MTRREPVEKGQSLEKGLVHSLFDGSHPLPTAVLLEDALMHNIDLMSRYCSQHSVLLAPHGKTTMCEEIIRRQLDAGAWGITVATAWQASVIAPMGVGRILIANEVVDAGSLRLLDDLLEHDPGLDLYCYVDSDAGLARLVDTLTSTALDRLGILVELGVTGARTGLRSDVDALALARQVADSPARLVGFAAFEGLLDGGSLAATLEMVDELIERLRRVALAAHDQRLFATAEPIITVGGSAYFDRVVAELPEAVGRFGGRVVLRSGCYVTHDDGTYAAVSPLGRRSSGGEILRSALEVWAPVLSRPEPGRAILGLGRRDVSADAGLPIPRRVRSADLRMAAAGSGWTAVAINDQHLHLQVPSDAALAVGDLVAFGVSHPCTTFDKWRAIPLVDDDYRVTGIATTHF